MNVMQIVAKASNPLTLMMGASSVVFGTAAAVIHGNEETLPTFLCLLFAIFAQIVGNITHRYADYRGNYGENVADGIREGLTPFPLQMVFTEGITAFSIVATMIGIAILVMAGWWTLAIYAMVAGVILVINFCRTAWPRSSTYLIMTFLVFGPIGVLGTSLVQSANSPIPSLFNEWDIMPGVLLSVVSGLYAVNIHLTYWAFNYRGADPSKINVFIVRFGAARTRNLVIANGIVIAAVAGVSPWLLYAGNLLYLIPVLLSLVVTIWCAMRIGRGEVCFNDWLIMSLNMAVFAVVTLVMFNITGYSYGSTELRPY